MCVLRDSFSLPPPPLAPAPLSRPRGLPAIGCKMPRPRTESLEFYRALRNVCLYVDLKNRRGEKCMEERSFEILLYGDSVRKFPEIRPGTREAFIQ